MAMDAGRRFVGLVHFHMQRSTSPLEMKTRARCSRALALPIACLLCRSQKVTSFSLVPPMLFGGKGACAASLIFSHRSSSSSTLVVSPRYLSANNDGNINDVSEVIRDIFTIQSDYDGTIKSTSMSTTFDQKQLDHRQRKLNRDAMWPQDHGRKRNGITSSRVVVPKKELRDFISGNASKTSSGRTVPKSSVGATNDNAKQPPTMPALDDGFVQQQIAHRRSKLSRDHLWPQDHRRKKSSVVLSREEKLDMKSSVGSTGVEGTTSSSDTMSRLRLTTDTAKDKNGTDDPPKILSSDPSPNFNFEMPRWVRRRNNNNFGRRNVMWPQSQYPKKKSIDGFFIPRTEEIPKMEINTDIDSVGITDNAQMTPPRAELNSLPAHTSIATDAGPLWKEELREDAIHPLFSSRKRVLVLCTGGTLTMSNDPSKGNSLVPVQGALTTYLSGMRELTEDPDMPEIISHEYKPLIDSSDMGPGDWAMLARDISTNYYYFDGFVVLMGTDTMAYAASALSFMLQNLGKPVIFTGSQIPLREPYNDARKNLIMATIFASSDTVSEVCIFFHDRLLRGCRATKVNTSKLKAFDSPNLPPLAEIGINIEENYHIFRPPPRGSFRINTSMDTRLITLRLVPGFDDASMKAMIGAATQTHLKGLILQLYGTGNLPSVKDDLVQCLANATAAGVVVVATTQCLSGSVIMGHYATGQKLIGAGVVSAGDMTVEAATTKLAYLLGRGDLSISEVRDLMTVDLRGEMTPECDLPPPPLASTYQRVIAQKNRSRRF